jgi:AbrB family looped-hinge helix DNA binding protein
MIESKIARYGNSLTVRLPAALARELNLREGDRVRLRRVKEGLMLEPVRGSRLDAWLASVKEPESEMGAGVAVGAEVFE